MNYSWRHANPIFRNERYHTQLCRCSQLQYLCDLHQRCFEYDPYDLRKDTTIISFILICAQYNNKWVCILATSWTVAVELQVTKNGKKLTITTPPFWATNCKISSGTLRVVLHNAYAEEWEKMTGAVLVSSASLIVLRETCDKSISIPNRFISATTVCWVHRFNLI